MTLEGQYAGFTLELRDPGIAWIRFDRAEGTFNGFTSPMKRDLIDTIHELNFRPDTRVIVFTGANNAFCAGDDVKNYYDEKHWQEGEGARGRNLLSERRLDGVGLTGRLRLVSQKLTQAVYETDLITIAAIDGACIQSALSLALACDFRIATPNAKIGSGTLRFAFQPDENGHYLLVRQIGVARTLDFLINSRIVSGDEALEWNLVNEVVPQDAIEERAMAMATKIAEGPMAATRMLKRAVYRAYEQDFAGAGEDIALRTAITDHHSDVAEGMSAWIEKRKPRFNGSTEPEDGAGPKQVYRSGVGLVTE
ncbi:MAG: enoyl-CoA hydratase/isomerase family protein [Sphingobium sp.]